MRSSITKITRREILGIIGLVVFIIGLLLVGSQIDLTFISDYVKNAGVWAPLVFILVKASTITFAPLSGTPLYVLAGTMFGLSGGIFYTFLGDLLGFSILFFLSRIYGLRFIKFLTKKKDSNFILLIQKNINDVRSFIKITLVFFWFPEATIAASGLGKLKYTTIMIVFMPIYSAVASLVVFVSWKVLG